jgi:hypothetical protein
VPHVEAGEHEVERDQPEEHAAVEAAERERHGETHDGGDAEAEPAVRAASALTT